MSYKTMSYKKLTKQIVRELIDKEYPKEDIRRGFVILYTIQLLDYLEEKGLQICKKKNI